MGNPFADAQSPQMTPRGGLGVLSGSRPITGQTQWSLPRNEQILKGRQPLPSGLSVLDMPDEKWQSRNELLQILSGIPGSDVLAAKSLAALIPGVIKNKGGNWLSGSVEGALKGLKRSTPSFGAGPESQTERLLWEQTQPAGQLNQWIDQKLGKYIKNEMATPEDPIRALAEKGTLHVDPDQLRRTGQDLESLRGRAGFPQQGVGESIPASQWENTSDTNLGMQLAKDRRIGSQVEENPWLAKIDPNIPTYHTTRGMTENLGFNHLIDELSNAINPASGLPPNLLFPADRLSKVTVPQAVERVSQINAWRAAQKAEADALKARNPATHLHKDYPDSDYAWMELKSPETLPEGYTLTPHADQPEKYGYYVHDPKGNEIGWGQTEKQAIAKANQTPLEEALKYEGDTMQHCVGSYCPDVAEGRTRILSLRNKKTGEPHTTVEVIPPMFSRASKWGDLSPEDKVKISNKLNSEGDKALFERYGDDTQIYFRPDDSIRIMPPEELLDPITISKSLNPIIKQIKGKQNRAPNPEYLPYVQDLVKSGKWGDVRDLQNSGLLSREEPAENWANELKLTSDQLSKIRPVYSEFVESLPGDYVTHDEWLNTMRDFVSKKGFATDGVVTPQVTPEQFGTLLRGLLDVQ